MRLVQVFNHRKTKVATQLANTHKCDFTNNYSLINTEADVYFICVKDDAIAEVAKKLAPLNSKGLFLHTSGSIDISVISSCLKNAGVFYPLQTFSKNDTLDWNEIPILIEANSNSSLSKLKMLAQLFSPLVKSMSSQKRLTVHLSAVFACNFTNALYEASQQIMSNGVSKSEVKLLEPLMKQSFNKMLALGPKSAQTGPAKRNDKVTMQKHLTILKSNKQLSTIYKSLSALIISQQNEKF